MQRTVSANVEVERFPVDRNDREAAAVDGQAVTNGEVWPPLMVANLPEAVEPMAPVQTTSKQAA